MFVISKSSDVMSRSAEQPSHFLGCCTVCSPVVNGGNSPQPGLHEHCEVACNDGWPVNSHLGDDGGSVPLRLAHEKRETKLRDRATAAVRGLNYAETSAKSHMYGRCSETLLDMLVLLFVRPLCVLH